MDREEKVRATALSVAQCSMYVNPQHAGYVHLLCRRHLHVHLLLPHMEVSGMILALSISDLYSSSVQLLMLSSIHGADEDVEVMSRDELRFGQLTRVSKTRSLNSGNTYFHQRLSHIASPGNREPATTRFLSLSSMSKSS